MSTTYWRVRMSGADKALREFLSIHPNDPQAVRVNAERVTFELLLSEALLSEAAKFGAVERLYNASEVGLARQSQVGKGNRFKNGDIPIGLGLRR